jgi:hypothetical protein
MQRNTLSFKGQNIFIGIDVHKRSWTVTTIPEFGKQRTHVQNASGKELIDFLNRHYPDGSYTAVYETLDKEQDYPTLSKIKPAELPRA